VEHRCPVLPCRSRSIISNLFQVSSAPIFLVTAIGNLTRSNFNFSRTFFSRLSRFVLDVVRSDARMDGKLEEATVGLAVRLASLDERFRTRSKAIFNGEPD
jgi:hypothetical protein